MARVGARADARARAEATTTTTTGASFDEKLEAVRADARKKRLETPRGTGGASGTFDMDAKVSFGGGGAAKPAGPMANYMDEERAATASEDEDGNQTLVRVVSFLAACALLVVFIPSDLTFQAAIPQGKGGLSESVKEEVQKQADAVVEALSAAPEDADKLRQAAQSFLALDDYPKALPYLERLVAVDPTNEENVSALAETWIADGQPRRAVEAFRTIIDADVLGKGQTAPSPSFLRGFLDALGKDGRNGLALDYAKTFSKKGWVDEVDGRLLEARVQSAWKGHGKDAEIAYEAVIAEHPEDFRGYLAQGVFFPNRRQAGRRRRRVSQSQIVGAERHRERRQPSHRRVQGIEALTPHVVFPLITPHSSVSFIPRPRSIHRVASVAPRPCLISNFSLELSIDRTRAHRVTPRRARRPARRPAVTQCTSRAPRCLPRRDRARVRSTAPNNARSRAHSKSSMRT